MCSRERKSTRKGGKNQRNWKIRRRFIVGFYVLCTLRCFNVAKMVLSFCLKLRMVKNGYKKLEIVRNG
jgi:hypothetical protein